MTGTRSTKHLLGEKIGLIGHYAWYFTAAALIANSAYASSPGGAPLLAVGQVRLWILIDAHMYVCHDAA